MLCRNEVFLATKTLQHKSNVSCKPYRAVDLLTKFRGMYGSQEEFVGTS